MTVPEGVGVNGRTRRLVVSRIGRGGVEIDSSMQSWRIDSDTVELWGRRVGLFIGVGPVENVLRARWYIGLALCLQGGVLAQQALAPAVPEVGGHRRGEDEDSHHDCTGDCTLADTRLGRGRGIDLVSCDAHCHRALVAIAGGRGRHMLRVI